MDLVEISSVALSEGKPASIHSSLFGPEQFVPEQSLFSMELSEVSIGGIVTVFIRNIIEAILTELLSALSILRSCNLQSDLGPKAEKPLKYVSIEERYMGQSNHMECKIGSTDNNFDKLAMDINMLYCIFKETCREVKKYGTYTSLENAIKIINRMNAEEEQLLKNEKEKEEIIENLRNLHEKERLENIRTIEETEANIQKLKFQLEDIHIYGLQEVVYFDKWEKSRLEQNELKLKETENHYKLIIGDATEKIQLEERCHSETMKFLEEDKDDDMEAIQFWMKKYDGETEKREEDIIHLRSDLEKLMDDRTNLLEKYIQRSAAINDWLEYKRIKNEKEQHELMEYKAAVKIQGWWRGVMVRKKLGPYRIKRKGKGKDKKKGKKK